MEHRTSKILFIQVAIGSQPVQLGLVRHRRILRVRNKKSQPRGALLRNNMISRHIPAAGSPRLLHRWEGNRGVRFSLPRRAADKPGVKPFWDLPYYSVKHPLAALVGEPHPSQCTTEKRGQDNGGTQCRSRAPAQSPRLEDALSGSLVLATFRSTEAFAKLRPPRARWLNPIPL